jgi:NAD(P)-dependent dehydrogenase (short-subunit alcohol dehydrogenase family)
MEREFEGKVAIVTGSGSGMGRASALAFAREGAKVIVSDVIVEGGEQTVSMIKERGGEATFIKTDVSKESEVKEMVDRTVEIYGHLDCAHNNAGVAAIRAPITECTENDWDRVMSINLKGVWLCMKHEIRQMLKKGKGAIVNTSSMTAVKPLPNIAAYVASKAGVSGLTKAAALEYTKFGIRVNAICPGTILTPFVERRIGGDPQVEAQFKAAMLVGRFGTAEEIAEAVLWLCSDSASFVIGHNMIVDGGMLIK